MKKNNSSGRRAKVARVLAALEHRESDRVPVGEWFWTKFLRRASAELWGGKSLDPYQYFDLDLVVINPNMDPRIQEFELLKEDKKSITVKTGWGATIQVVNEYSMPNYLVFDTQTVEQIEKFEFVDFSDVRRYRESIGDQINGVRDILDSSLPPWLERVNKYAKDFCIFGSVCEPYETLWRIIGPENALMKIAESPDVIARFVERIGDFMVGMAREQIAQADGKLTGLYIWGDVAYNKGLLFSPDYWRNVFKPQVKRICDEVHRHGLKVIYHGCGNASVIFEDLIEAGIDAYNSLEAKTGLDVVDLKRKFAGRLAFNGNIDVSVLSTGNREAIRREVLYKLNAAKGGGFIFQSDHSIPDNIAPKDYVYALELVREFGKYPLQLGEYDESVRIKASNI